MENYLVIDGGGTFTKYALMDENAAILEKNKVPTPGYKDHKKEDYYRMLDGIAEQYRDRIAVPSRFPSGTVKAALLPYSGVTVKRNLLSYSP